MGGLSWWHWLIIAGAFIIIFGAKKLPDAARGVGRSLRILKSEVSAMQDDDEKAKKTPSETDATASLATPTAQITGTPAVVQQPVPTVVQQPVPTVVQQPVQSAVPVDERRV